MNFKGLSVHRIVLDFGGETDIATGKAVWMARCHKNAGYDFEASSRVRVCGMVTLTTLIISSNFAFTITLPTAMPPCLYLVSRRDGPVVPSKEPEVGSDRPR
jgi:hypothetical protein